MENVTTITWWRWINFHRRPTFIFCMLSAHTNQATAAAIIFRVQFSIELDKMSRFFPTHLPTIAWLYPKSVGAGATSYCNLVDRSETFIQFYTWHKNWSIENYAKNVKKWKKKTKLNWKWNQLNLRSSLLLNKRSIIHCSVSQSSSSGGNSYVY